MTKVFTATTDAPKLLPFTAYLSQPVGSTLFMTCNAIKRGSQFGDSLRFQWFRNNREIVADSSTVIDSSRFSIEMRSTLSHFTLNDLTAHDYANYSCTVSAGALSDSTWTLLQVKGLPFSNFFSHLTKRNFSQSNCRLSC